MPLCPNSGTPGQLSHNPCRTYGQTLTTGA